jgi:hypothetical protein
LWAGRAVTFSPPTAQACREFLYRFVAVDRLSKKNLKVANRSDALLTGEFIERERSGGVRSGRTD